MSGDDQRRVAASVKQRLLNYSRDHGEVFNLVLLRFAIERLLYRLTQSPHADAFVLKGAMLFAAWTGKPHRPTQDVDLLGFGDPSTERLASVFRQIAIVEVEPDGLTFDAASVQVEPIREEAIYDGLRVRLLAFLGTARIPLQVDVGFGDAITPGPRDLTFGPMLDLPAPRLRTYPPATVVAEKLDAIIVLRSRATATIALVVAPRRLSTHQIPIRTPQTEERHSMSMRVKPSGSWSRSTTRATIPQWTARMCTGYTSMKC